MHTSLFYLRFPSHLPPSYFPSHCSFCRPFCSFSRTGTTCTMSGKSTSVGRLRVGTPRREEGSKKKRAVLEVQYPPRNQDTYCWVVVNSAQ